MTTTTVPIRPGAQAAPARMAIAQLSTPMILVLHLLPGALMTAGFVALAPLVEAAGFPAITALLGAIVLVLVPVELGILWLASRSEGVSVRELIPYRRRLTARDWAWLVPSLIVVAFVGFGVHRLIEPALIESLFGWLPAWFVNPIDVDRIGQYAVTAWVVTLAVYAVINGLLGPIVEELYFRGYLLPRMERFGRWAPLVNVTLFSLYHFWSPWQLLARILGLGPTVYAVRWKRNVRLGMVVHCSLNTLGVLTVAMLVMGRL